MSHYSIPCPECARNLKVPPGLLGRKVRCPACVTTFLAQEPPEEAVEEIIDDLEIVEVPSPRRPGAAITGRPKRRPRPDFEEDDRDDDSDTPRPRRRKRRSLAKAADAVAGPAIGLIIVGTLGMVIALAWILMQLTLPASPLEAPPGAQSYKIGYCLGLFVSGLLSLAVLLGGVKMRNLHDGRSVRTAAIIAMLPCTSAWIVGLPLGIWALVALSKPEVKRAFERDY